MAISTNQKPTIYRNLYENTDTGAFISLLLTNLNVLWLTLSTWNDTLPNIVCPTDEEDGPK